MTLIYCLHGDEIATEQVAKQLNKELGVEIILGNPKAREKQIRFIESDLNRSFGKTGTYESNRANELMELLNSKNEGLIIDLHTTNSGMPPVAIITNLKQLKLVARTGIQKIIYMNEEFSAGGSLIENVPNSFSIEFSPDTKSAENVKAFIRSAFEGKIKVDKVEVYEVIEIARGEHDPKIQNFIKLPDGTYPVFSGEKAYKGISFLRTKKRSIII